MNRGSQLFAPRSGRLVSPPLDNIREMGSPSVALFYLREVTVPGASKPVVYGGERRTIGRSTGQPSDAYCFFRTG